MNWRLYWIEGLYFIIKHFKILASFHYNLTFIVIIYNIFNFVNAAEATFANKTIDLVLALKYGALEMFRFWHFILVVHLFSVAIYLFKINTLINF